MAAGGYKIRNQQAVHFITFAVVDWIDVFTRKDYCQIVVDSLRHCQKHKGLIIYAWCLMSNHLHLIVAAKGNTLSDILRDFKKYTSRHIVENIRKNRIESRRIWMLYLMRLAGRNNTRNKIFQFWRQDNCPKQLDSNYMIDQKLAYIHNNPVKSGLVFEPEQYCWSSAINYGGGKGFIEIEFVG